MKTCKDCNWSEPRENHSWELQTALTCNSPKFGYQGCDNDGLAYWDEESYRADFFVGPDFGCVHWDD